MKATLKPLAKKTAELLKQKSQVCTFVKMDLLDGEEIMNSQQKSAEYWKNRNIGNAQGIKEKSEQKKSEEFLEDKGFVMFEYQPYRKISVFVRYIGALTIYKSVRHDGDIVDGNLLEGKS